MLTPALQLPMCFRATTTSYGYRRMRAALGRRRLYLSEKVVQRLMKQEGLIVPARKKRRYGSYLGEISPAPDNLLNRDFQAAAPNEKWLTDITEFQIPAGKGLPLACDRLLRWHGGELDAWHPTGL